MVWGDDAPAFELLQREVREGTREGGLARPEFQVGRFWRGRRKNGALEFLPKTIQIPPKNLGLAFLWSFLKA